MLNVKFVMHEGHEVPKHATEKSAGLDLYALENVRLEPGQRKVVDTTIKQLQLPDGYEAQIRPRSGLAAKQGLTVLNAPGTIDADYLGPIKVILYNTNKFDVIAVPTTKAIAQMVVKKYEQVASSKGDYIDPSNVAGRGAGGMGSTDIAPAIEEAPKMEALLNEKETQEIVTEAPSKKSNTKPQTKKK